MIDPKFREAERKYLKSVKDSPEESCFLWTALLLLSRQDNTKPYQLIVDFGDNKHKPLRLLQPNSPSIRKPASGKGAGRGKGKGKGSGKGAGGKGGKGQSSSTSSTTGGSPATLRSGALFGGRGNGARVSRVRERIRMVRIVNPHGIESVPVDVNAAEEPISTSASVMSSLRSMKLQLYSCRHSYS